MSLMPSTGVELSCYQGYTWSQEFDFWQDTAQTVPFSFSGWTVSFVVKARDGTTISASENITGGSIVFSLTSDQTETLPLGAARFAISMSDTGTPPEKDPLMAGSFIVKPLI